MKRILYRNEPVMGGLVKSAHIQDWTINWEWKGEYRHWCSQKRNSQKFPVAFIMYNPGSLSGEGEKIHLDKTLETLRDVFAPTNAYPIIFNLFDLANPDENYLNNNWHIRDADTIIFDQVDFSEITAVIYAYGDAPIRSVHKDEILQRVAYIKRKFSKIPEIPQPLNKSGYPKHPRRYKIEKLIPDISKRIQEFFS